jgi:16S rRNA U516 pseudouridylate synthase RsuA-like enzyme
MLRAIKIIKNKKKYCYNVMLNEWKKRHIRRMFKTIGYHVMDLERIREGKYSLGDVKVGEWKIIEQK